MATIMDGRMFHIHLSQPLCCHQPIKYAALGRCHGVGLYFYVDQCRVNSMQFLVNFVQFLEVNRVASCSVI